MGALTSHSIYYFNEGVELGVGKSYQNHHMKPILKILVPSKTLDPNNGNIVERQENNQNFIILTLA